MKSGRRLKGSSEPNSNRTRAGPLESQKTGVDGGCILSSAEQTTPFSTLNGLERAFTGEAYSEGGHDFFWLCNFILCLTKDGVRELARNVPVTMLLWRRPDSTATATATASTAGTTSSTSSASTSNRASTASDGAARKRRRLPTEEAASHGGVLGFSPHPRRYGEAIASKWVRRTRNRHFCYNFGHLKKFIWCFFIIFTLLEHYIGIGGFVTQIGDFYCQKPIWPTLPICENYSFS